MKLCKKIKSIYKLIDEKINSVVRRQYLIKLRKRFKNPTLSVFASNCIGCLILHDLGVRFNSPFVNLYLNAEDYLKFLKKPREYLEMDFGKVETEHPYPVATLGDLTFHFVHYRDYETAVTAFKKRTERINYENLFVIFSERDGCTYEDLLTFDNLPYKNKIVFTHLPYNDVESAFYIKGFEHEEQLGSMLGWDRRIGRKIYDRFDYVQWFNNQ